MKLRTQHHPLHMVRTLSHRTDCRLSSISCASSEFTSTALLVSSISQRMSKVGSGLGPGTLRDIKRHFLPRDHKRALDHINEIPRLTSFISAQGTVCLCLKCLCVLSSVCLCKFWRKREMFLLCTHIYTSFPYQRCGLYRSHIIVDIS